MGRSKDELLTVYVDQKPPGVELSGRISQLTRDGLPIWVNLANVLYVEGAKAEDGWIPHLERYVA